MNKVYTAWGILMLIILLGFAERYTAENVAESIIEASYNANEAAVSKSPDTYKLCHDMFDIWQRKKTVLQIFYPHPDLDSTDIALHSAEIFAQYGDYVNACVMIKTVCNKMESIKDGELISYTNLL
ncbi:MAG: DUF4363 family protein [Clostridia bacterium]|nr:DUF4363 family protein [Clostridia bacterium]